MAKSKKEVTAENNNSLTKLLTAPNSTNDLVPLMAAFEAFAATRRNVAGDIERTDKYSNINSGMIPFKSGGMAGYGNTNGIDVREAIILCQKAYYNIPCIRNTVDLMTEFTTNQILLRGGSKKSNIFFGEWLKKINSWDFTDQWFREFYRSGNVVTYRVESVIDEEGSKVLRMNLSLLGEDGIKIPIRYVILNPADIQLAGNISFSSPIYYKLLSDYELHRLRNPVTQEDKEILETLDPETKKLVNDKRTGSITMPLPTSKIITAFYKKQDYEPFSVPMCFPVLDLVNWKYEMMKQDMAISRTMQQAILLITMGNEPEKGGLNPKAMEAMRLMFENESVGRVIVADYTTKAQFVIPGISELLDPKKYVVVDREIQTGLNTVLGTDEKFANQIIKVKVFMERLKQAQESFINNFLTPEIKRIAKNLGLKSYPTPYFKKIDLNDETEWNRLVTRMYEIGLLTPEDSLKAIETGTLPSIEELNESQIEFRTQKDKGFYAPIVGGPADQLKLAKETAKLKPTPGAGVKPGISAPNGRPSGTKRKQSTKKVKPMKGSFQDLNESSDSGLYSLSKIKDNLILAGEVESKIEKYLKDNNKDIAAKEGILELIVCNEEPENWANSIESYVKNPLDTDSERVRLVEEIAIQHGVTPFHASILFASRKEDESEVE